MQDPKEMPEQAPIAQRPAPGKSNRRTQSRSRYYHRYKRCKRQSGWLKIALLVSFLALSAVATFSYRYVSKASGQLVMPQQERDGYTARIAELETTVAELNDEILTLSQGRIPGLRRIEFDQVLQVDKEYVKNVVFSITRQGDKRTYEFKMLLHNAGPDILQPGGTLALFDRAGLQLGIVHFKKLEGSLFLAPGESRSYYDRVDLSRPGEPVYYMLELSSTG
jgi:cell division protein FtsB